MSSRLRMGGLLRAVLLTATAVAALSGCAGTPSPADPPETSTAAASASSSTAARPSSSTAERRQAFAVDYADGQVTGDTGRLVVPAGAPVTITVTSDVADEAHLHGYDLTAPLAPGTPAELAFDATIPGVFELELHDAGTVLLTLGRHRRFGYSLGSGPPMGEPPDRRATGVRYPA